MVDKVARADLADKLQLLVSGEMTNDEFDDAYYSRWLNTKDDAVREIANFGWGLYSSDLLFPYRLSTNKLPQQIKDMAARATTFLATEKCYPWPTNVEGVTSLSSFFSPWNCTIVCVGLLIGVLNGVFLVYMSVFAFLTFLIWLHWLFTHQQRRAEFDRFFASGDFEAWPFISKDEWQMVEKQRDGIGCDSQP